ncbi:hypothetical protein SERLADRAFT_401114 [Serpula lacrymans var. lacrymans S7.9]|uniref:Uncharacterized protein n=1 Tax=Serpula lacrymans var. lacrymans (strain S7.9) TaxID=578457 RepID=F8PAN1_SERL9|nr:uncharacterized protein SERLADRAFT_401114 [Serpula lacrymans var. lacrymans S7.9]EGO19869.1 hypothetical protein SERLADRAFT_401114 [Serpula lacrymans var. lacrymans S7.9]
MGLTLGNLLGQAGALRVRVQTTATAVARLSTATTGTKQPTIVLWAVTCTGYFKLKGR